MRNSVVLVVLGITKLLKMVINYASMNHEDFIMKGIKMLHIKIDRRVLDLGYTPEDATHYLECRHCIGNSCKIYYMDCVILNEMKDGRLKVLVFGDRYWKDTKHIQKIRYVEAWKVKKL